MLTGAMPRSTSEPSNPGISKKIRDHLELYFSPGRSGFLRFTTNVVAFTLCSMLILLTVYVFKTPGMSSVVGSAGFLKQFFGSGFVVTFLVNFFVFLAYPHVIRFMSAGSFARFVLVLAADILSKAILFCVLTAAMYLVFAVKHGAFQGDPDLAIRVIPDTLEYAIKWQSVTAVYLYSVILGSFPVFWVALVTMTATYPGVVKTITGPLSRLPFEPKPLLAISATFAIYAVIFCAAISLVISFI
ncbi:MAG: hypothetical protein QNJ85_20200 [Gammaproteobacteria bacterium]|nr:hypothetical protein [Gammaproteobacteria bacterium]